MTEGPITKADANSCPETSDRRRAPRPRRLHDEDSYAIFPIVHEKSGAKRWSIHLSRAGRAIQMAFPHLKYGGEAPALAVAKACRDAIVAVVPPMTHREMREIRRRNRAEGMPGVYHVTSDTPLGEVWIAQILLPDGHSRRRTFAVARYGDAGARQRAEAERQRMVDEVENVEDAALRSPAAVALGERLAAAAKDVSDGMIPPGIARDADEAPGWRVKVQANGVMLNHRFADATFGGELAALVVARAYREAVLTHVPSQAAADGGSGRKRPGTAAMPGVHYRPAQVGRGATWFARTVLPDGRVSIRAFSVSRYGEEDARGMAEAERLRMLEAENLASR